jgi:hypothetical protein
MVARQFQTHAPIASMSLLNLSMELRVLAIGAAVLAIPIGPARAQQTSVFRATPVNTPAVFYFHSHVVDCQGVVSYHMAIPATVVFPEHPAHGTVTRREGAAPVARCQGQLSHATIVIYTPAPGYSGPDNFQLRVLYDLKTHTELKTYNVRVQVGGNGKPG